MNKPPAFQFYPKDWFDKKVMRMTFEAQGVYIRLLCHMWKDSTDQCSLENNPVDIAKMIGLGIKKIKKILAEMQRPESKLFIEENGQLVSERLREEAKKYSIYREKQSLKGKISAQQRFNHGSTTVQPQAQPEGNSSSSSSSSSKSIVLPNGNTHTVKGGESEFNRFWESYPKKVGKGAAQRSWKSAKEKPTVGELVKILEKQKTWDQWRRGYIPNPATWLNQKRWLDEKPPDLQDFGKIGETDGIQQWLKNNNPTEAQHEST